MLAHRLRHRVEFQELVEEQDSETGASVLTWVTAFLDSDTPLDSVPAEVLTGPGREFRESGTTQAETTARINLRWFPGLSSEWRLLWDGRVYNIGSIETDATGRREYWLRCTDGVSDGR
ncbi:MAG TPA: head-tail adaptor protein [Nitrospiraceae bacterium]|nr:head-tail adaptor protein [Nitrospiraceae bacterium]